MAVYSNLIATRAEVVRRALDARGGHWRPQ